MRRERMNLSVLFVEDEPAAREKVSAILGRNVRTVYQAEDGLKGLDVFKEHRPEVVITDIKGGTGLGLAIAYKIIQNYGGSIAVVPAFGCGTTFELRLPAGQRREATHS